MINKKFIHVNSLSGFQKLKLSANSKNTSYNIYGTDGTFQGAPDVPYDSIVFVKEKGIMWTHGKVYNDSQSSSNLNYCPHVENPSTFSANVDQIIQYTGQTNSTYTNGYFYKFNGSSWVNINVQPTDDGWEVVD